MYCARVSRNTLQYQVYKNTVSQYDMYPDRSINFCRSSDQQQKSNYIYKQIWLECHDIYNVFKKQLCHTLLVLFTNVDEDLMICRMIQVDKEIF